MNNSFFVLFHLSSPAAKFGMEKWIKKKTNTKPTKTCAVNIPWAGENTFKYKQSSDWFCKNGNNRFRYSNRPFGIFSKAPVSFCMFGKRCGHTGLNLSAIRIPFHGDGARVGLNLQVGKKEKTKRILNSWMNRLLVLVNWICLFLIFMVNTFAILSP